MGREGVSTAGTAGAMRDTRGRSRCGSREVLIVRANFGGFARPVGALFRVMGIPILLLRLGFVLAFVVPFKSVCSSSRFKAEKSPRRTPTEALVEPCRTPTPGAKAQSGIRSTGGGTVAPLGEVKGSEVIVRLATGAGGYCFSC